MARAVPHVFTIAPGLDFARTVVEAILDSRLIGVDFAEDIARLADLVIYVPTQRVRRLLEAAFAEALAPRPAILPRIRPLADPGDPLDRLFGEGGDVLAFAGEMLAGEIPSLQPVITPIQRRFLLLPLIERWRLALHREAAEEAETGAMPDAGVSVREQLMLADALGRLIDEMRIADVPLESLESTAPPGYDPARFDRYWEKTRDFLRIAATYWPQALAEAGARDEMDIRLETIETEARRLEREDPETPVIVIGSTGSVSATARLMRAVSRLNHGAVVLPGLDLGLDEAAWTAIGAKTATLATRFAHPQAALKRVLAEIGLPRDAVGVLAPEATEEEARNRAISESLRPAELVDAWRENAVAIDLDRAFEGITLVETADEREEALAVALLIRETLENAEVTIAFVTADRGLARRVRGEMRRWGVEVEDSAGTPLAEQPAGTLLRLFLRAATQRDGASVLALLRHPLARVGFSAEALEQLADAFEILVLRGRHFSPALDLPERVRHALANRSSHPHPAETRIPDEDCTRLPLLARALEAAFAAFAPEAPARAISEAALDLIEVLSRFTQDAAGVVALESDPDGAELVEMLQEIGMHGETCRANPVALAGAMDVFLHERILPSARTGHPRAAILGPLEARLVSANRVVLGGLNEGSFPPIAQEDPFLNRAMRLDLGLQPPERRIGQSAHDFVMLAGSRNVVFTRAARAGGQPTIPSRFLRRLEAFAGNTRWEDIARRGASVLRLARMLDEPQAFVPISAPEPVPQAPRVPLRLSITEVETLRRDPYAIYAKHILRLAPLDPIESEPDGRERGTILHACLEEFARTDPPHDPELAAQALREIGTRQFEPIQHERELFHFWWQRFEALIPDFIAFDRARRDAGHEILTEVRGGLSLRLDTGDDITISGKADRIEKDPNGRIGILDYKSGAPPSPSMIERGLAPQLPITAALVARGAFTTLPSTLELTELAHITIGGSDPLELKPVKSKTLPLNELAERDWQQLVTELNGFAAGRTAYRSRIAPARQSRDGDFDHLARVREWSLTGGSPEAADDPGGDPE